MSEKHHGLGPLASKINFDPELNPSSPSKSGETGLPVLDAADKIFKNLYRDEATGCYNRNFWEDFVKKFDPQRGDQASLILCDINNLKETNDIKGHSAGDKLIKDTADFLKNSFNRKGDSIIRLGGDEFLVLCLHVGDKAAFSKKVLEKFAPQVLEQNYIDFAFGVAHFDQSIDTDGLAAIKPTDTNPETLNTTLNRADNLMYQNKIEGKIN